MGWIGSSKQMLYVMEHFGADKDEDGNFLVYGEEPVSFLGLGEEYVVSDKVEYSVNNKRFSLAAALGQTSYGMKVKVI